MPAALVTILLVAATTLAAVAQRWTPEPGIVRPELTSTSSIRVGNRIRTYFMDRGVILFAESDGGRNLSRTTETNVRGSRQQGDEQAFIANPAVIQRSDGKFVMVYDASPELQPPVFPRRMYVRISDNGVTFGPPSPLPTTSLDFNARGQLFQSVPDLVRLPDGSLRLYYTAGGAAIGSMRSADGGQAWAPEPEDRLGQRQTPGQARTAAYVDPDVVVQADGSFLMYLAYSEFEQRCGGLGCQVIRLAVSTDGLTFTMESGVLIGPTGSARGVVDPDVFQTADGRWYMLYGEDSGRIHLRLATRTE